MKLIKELSITNFRGIKNIENLNFGDLNIFIGDNGTSKTSILEAINFSFSPSFLSGRIKHTDFHNGTIEPININILFQNSIKAKLPDGYAEQEITCDKISLTIRKRLKKTAGKVFSDLVTVEHLLIPDFEKKSEKGWSIKRKNETEFPFTERSLVLSSIHSDDLPRSFYFSKDRGRQLYKGFNTSFSTIIDDLNWRFDRSVRKEMDNTEQNEDIYTQIRNLQQSINSKINLDETDVFKELNDRMTKFLNDKVNISLIDVVAPYDSAYMSKIEGNLDLPIKYLGSGIEMIVALLLLETLASLSKEKLIIIIDEPELHLHPKLQEILSEYLINISQTHQIFVSTHSPIFFKHCMSKSGVKTFITKKGTSALNIDEFDNRTGIFPWSPTWGEINFFAYDYPTLEFHNELYGYIQEKESKFTQNEIESYLQSKGLDKTKKWNKEREGTPLGEDDVTLQTFIRNKVHHPENVTMQSQNYSPDELKQSIIEMISIL